MCYELYGLFSNYFDFYLNNGISILLWNYKGYGLRSGSADFQSLLNEGIEVFDYIKEEKYKWDRVGIYGLSIGGYVACNVAKFRQFDLLIADRTFASIDNLIENFIFGKYLLKIYKFFLPGVSSDNVEGYLNAKVENKIMLMDVADDIISLQGSLKEGVSKRIFEDIIKQNIFKTISTDLLTENNNNNAKITNITTLREFIFTKEEIKNFIQSVRTIYEKLIVKDPVTNQLSYIYEIIPKKIAVILYCIILKHIPSPIIDSFEKDPDTFIEVNNNLI
jgi:hypothetical protein